MEFQVGDKVRGIGDTDVKGYEGYITEVCDELYKVKITKIGDDDWYILNGSKEWRLGNIKEMSMSWGDSSLIKIGKTNKKTKMQKLTSMLKRLLDANSQALYKAGLINGDLELTERGEEELMGIVFDTYKVQLVEKAKEIIAEEEKK